MNDTINIIVDGITVVKNQPVNNGGIYHIELPPVEIEEDKVMGKNTLPNKAFITQTAEDYCMTYEDVERIYKKSGPETFYDNLELFIKDRARIDNGVNK